MKTRILLTTAAALSICNLSAYDLHEWGTFTTVAGSDGVLLTGLEREEEALPSYVRHHPGFMNHHPAFANVFMKRMPVPARNVKVKMETPVIYFHSDEAFTAKVKVGFEGGTISQWYPERSGGESIRFPDPGSAAGPRYLDFAKPYTGSIEWEIDVLSPEESRETILFKSEDLLQWTRARIPEANVVRDSSGATEGFLFYRGLGSFTPGLTTRVSQDETLSLTNDTEGAIPYLLIYERQANGTHWWTEHKGLAKGETIRFSEADLSREGKGTFDSELYLSLSRNLAQQGLLKSESRAMVETWWKSYFAAPGLRVFWVLPDARTEAILPLEVSPAPEKTVRVLVGRSEIIRPRQEALWLSQANSKDDNEKNAWNMLTLSDRFGAAYLERVQALQQQAKH
ncbi:hypothetical protein [Haloferula rosea]|uniref:Uncharacterized protein n=1 Tax=Haloferula rosea TaxID=490093 RepID=A0A934R7D7_9BACT|nr:hypothetical protein [Haloferula rosea]MBK1826634.1 hypothetical protein [Haloferula rosea]